MTKSPLAKYVELPEAEKRRIIVEALRQAKREQIEMVCKFRKEAM